MDDIIFKREWHVTVSTDIFYLCHCAFGHPGSPERENSGSFYHRTPTDFITGGEWGIHAE
jgi:hypothetical protein